MSEEQKQISKARQALVDRVLSRLDEGAIPWDDGMQGVRVKPFNAVSGAQYRGMNALNLMLAYKSDPRWLTFNQATDAGYKVKKGAKGVPIELYKIIDRRTKKEADLEAIREEIKDMTFMERQEFKRHNLQTFARSYYVFNASDVVGIEPYKAPELTPADISARNELIEQVIAGSQAPISYDGNGRNYYSPASDEIHLTERTAFKSDEFFYNTALHEMAHSTGHSSRLNREGGRFGSAAYAREELVAEISSVLVAAEFGLVYSDRTIENSAEYVRSWARLIRDNPQTLIDATFDASRATDYVCDYERQRAQTKYALSPIVTVEAIQNYAVVGQGAIKDMAEYPGFSILHDKANDTWYCLKDCFPRGEQIDEYSSRRLAIGDNARLNAILDNYDEQYRQEFLTRFESKSEALEYWERSSKIYADIREKYVDVNTVSKEKQSTYDSAANKSALFTDEKTQKENAASGAWVAERDGKNVVIGTWETHDISEQEKAPPEPEHKKPLMVNFYAGPGSGKTTAALELTAALKKAGYNVEYVSEYAKELVLENRTNELDDQRKVTDEQYRRFDRIRNSAEIIVTDSPVLLGMVYGDGKIDDEYKKQIRAYHDSFDNFNMLVARPENAKFQTEGRVHDEKQSLELDSKIKGMLDTQGVFYGSYKRDDISKTVERIGQTYERLYGEHQKVRTQKENAKPQTKSNAFKTQLENIPDAMKALPNWVAFRTHEVFNEKKQKYELKKTPLTPNQPRAVNSSMYLKWADHGDPKTWSTFDKAVALAKRYKLDGLAFAMSGSGITCIDLDHHIDENGKPSELAQKFLTAAQGTYVERSVSGHGLHIFYVGNRPDGYRARNDNINLETYDNVRFMSMTGDIYGNAPSELAPPSAALTELLKSNLKQVSQYSAPSVPLGMDDNALIDKIRSSKVAADFEALWNGNDICGNHSVSDFKLCNMIAFFSGGDAAQVERVFRSSGLYRPEKGDAYVKRTAQNACSTLQKSIDSRAYIPKSNANKNSGRPSGTGNAGR